MKKFLLIFCSILFICNSCSDTAENLHFDSDAKFSLISPNNVKLSNSIEDLEKTLTTNNEKIEIVNIEYIDLKDKKNAIAATIEYTKGQDVLFTLVLRNIENINFHKETVLRFVENSENSNKTQIQKDIYISCSGASCCYPSATYDSNTGIITTGCLCQGGGANSDCVMHISETPPQKK